MFKKTATGLVSVFATCPNPTASSTSEASTPTFALKAGTSYRMLVGSPSALTYTVDQKFILTGELENLPPPSAPSPQNLAVIGGDSASSCIDIYSISTGKWSSLTASLAFEHDFSPAACYAKVDNEPRIYVCGGDEK